MRRLLTGTVLGVLTGAFLASAAPAQICVDCHKTITPNIVSDWRLSKHRENDVQCSVCHGDRHVSEKDVAEALIPTPATCGGCHEDRVEQFRNGKHALAWASMKAMPTIHYQPMMLIEGMKGCGGCHKIGLKTEADIKELGGRGAATFGTAACDSCHTRHLFSAKEAREPEACRTCHMGFDHPQWEMYDSSKHGVRNALKRAGVIPDNAAAPTCQTCHMPDGNHGVRTAWGFLAVRLPMPADNQWAADRAAILQALGVLGPDGKPTGRLEVAKSADLARLSQEAWQAERDRMLAICRGCHSANFAAGELAKGDRMIREADHLMAEAIRIVAGLYKDGILPKPSGYPYSFPDLLTFHDAPTVIEQKLFIMFMEHRMRAFQGTFHANPDYAFWYGWSEMRRDMAEIEEAARDMRDKRRGPAGR